MSARLALWWNGLSRREHALLTVAAALLATVLIWAIVWGPVGRAYDSYAADYRAATERQGRVQAKLALLKSPVPAAVRGTPIDALARDSAAEIGVTLERAEARGEDAATIAIASIRTAALLPWLDGLERQGVIIDQLTVTPAPDRTLSVVADLRRAP
jgi:general secretion pathway protein M